MIENKTLLNEIIEVEELEAKLAPSGSVESFDE